MRKLNLSQIVATNIAYYRYSLDYFLDAMDQLGLHQIELWGGTGHFCIYDSEDNPVPALKKKLKEREFRLVSLMPEQNVYAINIAAPEKYLRQKSVDYLIANIRAAAELDCPMLLVNPGRAYLDRPLSEGYRYAKDSLEILVKEAEKTGIVLLYENLNDRESALATNCHDQFRVVREIDSPYLCCCVDTVPVACAGEDLELYFRVMGSKIRHIHLNDGRPWGHMAWGDGNLDLDAFLDVLREYDYSGYLDLEIDNGSYLLDPTPHYLMDLENVIPHFDEGHLI